MRRVLSVVSEQEVTSAVIAENCVSLLLMEESISYVKSNATTIHIFEQCYHETSSAYLCLTTAFLQKVIKTDSLCPYFYAQRKVCYLSCQEELSVYFGDIIKKH